jgi:fatty-acid desaturase
MVTFLIAFLLSYMYHGFGITVGYHRLLSHRAFKCPRWVEYLIVSGGYLALEGSPVSWVATHRVHHRFSDMEGDPHSPKDGLWHAFAGWLPNPIVRMTGEQIEQTVPDLWRDPVYRFLDFNHSRNHAWVCLGLCIALRVALFFLFGPIVVAANLAGMLAAFLGPFWVNSICHIREFGYRNFITEDGSRNVWWVGLVALGEGWHNNHHAVPQSARHGLKPAEIDFSWYFISVLRALGLATEIRLPKGSRSTPVLDAALAAELNVPCVADEVVAATKAQEQITAATADLQQQLVAARQLAAQMISACDALTQQMSDARADLSANVSQTKEQIAEQLSQARAQLADQLIGACDRLSEQLETTKEQLSGQIQVAAEQIAPKLVMAGQDAES